MTERQYPIHLRKIGEHQIAEFLETLIIELDTHEKMFLELCKVTRERDELGDRVSHSELVRHGRWIEGEMSHDMLSVWKCSECGLRMNGKTWRYCPNCGAKMDGGES